MAYHPDVRGGQLVALLPHIQYLLCIIRHISIDYSEYFFYNCFRTIVCVYNTRGCVEWKT
jgi:hypothetical protein